MSLEHKDNANKTILEYGKQAEFTCEVKLKEHVADEYDGISMQINNSQGIYEDSRCLTFSNQHDNKVFNEGDITCPDFAKDKLTYTVTTVFDVNAVFLGKNLYRCVFRTVSLGLLSDSFKIEIASRWITKVGVRVPTLLVTPLRLQNRFENETITISCSSRGGYPLGEIAIMIGNKTLKTLDIGEKQNSLLQTKVTLRKDHNQMVIKCLNYYHPDAMSISEPMKVGYFRHIFSKHEILQISVNNNLKVNCQDAVNTNTLLEFYWIGSIVADSQLRKSNIDIISSKDRANNSYNLVCVVSMKRDPLKRSLNITYRVTFEAAPPPPGFTGAAVIIIMVFVFVLLMLLGLIGFAVGRELTSRKINSRKRREKQVMKLRSLVTAITAVESLLSKNHSSRNPSQNTFFDPNSSSEWLKPRNAESATTIGPSPKLETFLTRLNQSSQKNVHPEQGLPDVEERDSGTS